MKIPSVYNLVRRILLEGKMHMHRPIQHMPDQISSIHTHIPLSSKKQLEGITLDVE